MSFALTRDQLRGFSPQRPHIGVSIVSATFKSALSRFNFRVRMEWTRLRVPPIFCAESGLVASSTTLQSKTKRGLNTTEAAGMEFIAGYRNDLETAFFFDHRIHSLLQQSKFPPSVMPTTHAKFPYILSCGWQIASPWIVANLLPYRSQIA